MHIVTASTHRLYSCNDAFGNEYQMNHRLAALAAALRPHQWLKNLLICVPAFAAHRLDAATVRPLVVGFVALSLVASGGYVLNDLLDLKADRTHPRKRGRVLAAGRISSREAAWLVVGTWLVGFALSTWMLSLGFVLALATYLLGSSLYSLRLKREPALDVMFLAGLYILRIVAGGAATGIPVSTWLMAFALFVCLSLAFLKRFVEIAALPPDASPYVAGRGYRAGDTYWLQAAGLASAYVSAVVLAIYVNNADVTRLYSKPERLLLMCPVVVYWATRSWMNAQRGITHDDPVVAIATDPVTYVLLAISMVIVVAAI